MKTFSQFLREAYIIENVDPSKSKSFIVRQREKLRQQRGIPGESLRREAEQVARSSSRRPRLTTTNVPRSNITGTKPQPSAPNYRPGEGRSPSPYSGVTSPSAKVEPVGTKYSQTTPSRPTTRGGTLATRPRTPSTLTPPTISTPTVKPKGFPWGKTLGALGTAYDLGSEFMSQKERGRSTPAAAAISATKTAGGLGGASLGAQGGAAAGAAIGALFGGAGAAPGALIGGALGGIGGYLGGSELAGAASETIAGATPKEKLAMAQANRMRQSGGLIKGTGGPTTVSQKRSGGPAFISTGTGKQRRTTQLPTTALFKKDGKQSTGYLAFKGGKPVYKQGPSAQSLARTSSNPLERVGRSLFSGAYKQHDIKKGQEAYRTALRNTQQYQKNLGITPQKAKSLGLPGR